MAQEDPPPAEERTEETKKNEVVTPQNVDPNETYNLPPNFNPNYKPRRTPRNVKVTIDFRQAKLDEVVKFYSSLMNQNFIIDDSLQANKTITIITPDPVTLGQAYKAFQLALEMNGLTIVTVGAFFKIVPAKEAIKEPSPIYPSGSRIPNEARMVTSIIPVENAPVEEIKTIITQFASKEATIQTYGSSLIITENGTNLRRIRRLIQRLDRGEGANQIYLYKVLNAEATEIQEKLTQIFNVQKQGAAPRNKNAKPVDGGAEGELDVEIGEIIADERTNQLIIVTDERSFRRIKQMIELLDVPTAVGGQINVRFLEYANAEDLAGTLSSLAGGAAAGGNARNRGRSRSPRTPPPPAGNDVAQLLQGEVQITSHKPTNSLIVVASPRDFVALDKVIKVLDRPRRQVYVEAVIMEIRFNVNRNLGLGVSGAAGIDGSSVIPDSAIEEGYVEGTDVGVGIRSNSPDVASLLTGTGGALGLVGPLLTVPGSISLPSFALVLQASQTDDNINILSTPSITTLDNEEAEIVVGERIPFPQAIGAGGLGGLGNLLGNAGGAQGAGAFAGLLGGGLLGTQVQYEDVGIQLRVLPQVNESQYVRLEVDQEVSSVGAPSELGPTRSKRSIKTIVLVKDQSTIVLGGLVRDEENETETKVPFFGDIPLIGNLFRNTSKQKTKQNLVLMLTPYIIESESDIQKIKERKRQEREELLKLFKKRDIDYVRSVNYDKKGGLLDRMQRVITTALEDEVARQEAIKAFEETGPRYQILGQPVPASEASQPVPTLEADQPVPVLETEVLEADQEAPETGVGGPSVEEIPAPEVEE